MATPPMLAPRDGSPPPSVRTGPDPVAALSALLLGLVCVGLLLAAILAVYDYSVPAVEGPLVALLAGVFGLVVAVNVLAATARWLRTLRR